MPTTVNNNPSPWCLSVAPMLDWTDRHCRYFHRQITKHTRLYTEMVTTGALIHGDVERHLGFDEIEHPLALQLGGSEPTDLAKCAQIAQQWGYDEVNLNCGCPSDRVQRGAFGACLMLEPQLVSDCVKAMYDAVSIPVTVKHRIGIDKNEDYAFVRDFVGTVSQAGCEVFIVHARNAWLKGLSPKENRDIPPLRYEAAYQLKKDFPTLTFVINGGIQSNKEIALHLQHLDGVMLGRQAYHDPYLMANWDQLFYNDAHPIASREEIEQEMIRYCAKVSTNREPWPRIMRHILGLYHSQPGARLWRQIWSDTDNRKLSVLDVAAKIQQLRKNFHTEPTI